MFMFRACVVSTPTFARRLLADAGTALPAWYAGDDAAPLMFKCTGCGKCCSVDGAVYVNTVEIAALAEAKKMSLKDFTAQHVGVSVQGEADDLNPTGATRNIILDRAADSGGGCSLLNKDGRTCSVYSARPIQCATYPFWPGILESHDTWLEEADYCEGVVASSMDGGNNVLAHGGTNHADSSIADARVPRELITANLTVVSLLEAQGEGGRGGEEAEVWSYTEARAAVDAAITSTPALLDDLEHDLFWSDEDDDDDNDDH